MATGGESVAPLLAAGTSSLARAARRTGCHHRADRTDHAQNPLGPFGFGDSGERALLPELASRVRLTGLRRCGFGEQSDAASVVDVDAGPVLRAHARVHARAGPRPEVARTSHLGVRRGPRHTWHRRRRIACRRSRLVRLGGVPPRRQSAVQLLRHGREAMGTARRRAVGRGHPPTAHAGTSQPTGDARLAARRRRCWGARAHRELRLVDQRGVGVSGRLDVDSRRRNTGPDLDGFTRRPRRGVERRRADQPSARAPAAGVARFGGLRALPVALAAAHLLPRVALPGRRELVRGHCDSRRIAAARVADDPVHRGSAAIRTEHRFRSLVSGRSHRRARNRDDHRRHDGRRLAAERSERDGQHRQPRPPALPRCARVPRRRADAPRRPAAHPGGRRQGLADHLVRLDDQRLEGPDDQGRRLRRSRRHTHRRAGRRIARGTVDHRARRRRQAARIPGHHLPEGRLRVDHLPRIHLVRAEVLPVQRLVTTRDGPVGRRQTRRRVHQQHTARRERSRRHRSQGLHRHLHAVP